MSFYFRQASYFVSNLLKAILLRQHVFFFAFLIGRVGHDIKLLVFQVLGHNHDVLSKHRVQDQHYHFTVFHISSFPNAFVQEILQLFFISKQASAVFVVLSVKLYELMSILLACIVIFQIPKALVCHALRRSLGCH